MKDNKVSWVSLRMYLFLVFLFYLLPRQEQNPIMRTQPESSSEATTDQEILNKDLESIIRKNSDKPTKED